MVNPANQLTRREDRRSKFEDVLCCKEAWHVDGRSLSLFLIAHYALHPSLLDIVGVVVRRVPEFGVRAEGGREAQIRSVGLCIGDCAHRGCGGIVGILAIIWRGRDGQVLHSQGTALGW